MHLLELAGVAGLEGGARRCQENGAALSAERALGCEVTGARVGAVGQADGHIDGHCAGLRGQLENGGKVRAEMKLNGAEDAWPVLGKGDDPAVAATVHASEFHAPPNSGASSFRSTPESLRRRASVMRNQSL